MQPAPVHSVDESTLWQRLRTDADQDARAQLLGLHLPYARTLAAMLYARRFHDEIEFAEYFQYASVGLLEALDRFDPDRGVQFRTFAARRMQGAILSGIERLTEKQQQIAARQRLREGRTESIKSMLDGGAGVRGRGDPFRYLAEVGLGLALAWLLDGTGMVDDPTRSEDLPFYRPTELRQLRERLLRLVEALPEQEKVVVRAHYLQDMQFDAIARMLHLTKGRISQIHKQALLHLRSGAGPLGLDLSF